MPRSPYLVRNQVRERLGRLWIYRDDGAAIQLEVGKTYLLSETEADRADLWVELQPASAGEEPALVAPSPHDVYLPSAGRAWFGATDSTTLPISTLESSVLSGSRTVDIVHVYRNWGDYTGAAAFPGNTSSGASIDAHLAAGRMLFLDWAPFTGTDATTGLPITAAGGWGSIASGAWDATHVDVLADKIAAWGASNPRRRIFFSLHHEADLMLQKAEQGSAGEQTIASAFGTAAQYRAAYRHVYDRFAARGAGNFCVFVWATEGHLDDVHYWNSMYPGDDVVDWLAYDPYGKVAPASATSTSRTFRNSFGRQVPADAQGTWRFYAWATGLGATSNTFSGAVIYRKQDVSAVSAQRLDIPIMASEFNSAYNPALNAANLATYRTFWDGAVQDVGSDLYPQIRAFVAFFSGSTDYDPRNDVGSGSVAAPQAGSILERFRALAALPRLNAQRPSP